VNARHSVCSKPAAGCRAPAFVGSRTQSRLLTVDGLPGSGRPIHDAVVEAGTISSPLSAGASRWRFCELFAAKWAGVGFGGGMGAAGGKKRLTFSLSCKGSNSIIEPVPP
jgi:hypothetical protein